MKGKLLAAGTVAAVLALAAPFWTGHEGRVHTPYRDIVGVLTVCDGHTGADIQNRRYSDVECDSLRAQDLLRADGFVRDCIPNPIPLSVEAALVDMTGNLGPRAVCGSTIQKQARAGDWKSVCAGILAWVNAGGVPNHGIANRRVDERELCLRDVN